MNYCFFYSNFHYSDIKPDYIHYSSSKVKYVKQINKKTRM